MPIKEFLTQPSLVLFGEDKVENSASDLKYLSVLPQIDKVSSIAVLDFTSHQTAEHRTINCALPEMKNVTIFSQMIDFNKAYASKKEIPQGIVIKSNFNDFSSLSEEQISSLYFLFKERLGKSASKSPRKVWLVETEALVSVSEKETEKRKAFMQRIGLVDFASGYNRKSGVSWSRARLPKQKEYQEVDLTKKLWYLRMISRLREEAFLVGYKQIDISELEERVKKSRSAYFAIRKIRDGCGVVRECYCGCKILTRWNGSETEIINNHDKSCLGSPRPEDIVHNRIELAKKAGIHLNRNGDYLVGYDIPYEEAIGIINRCGDCSRDYVIDRVVIGGNRQNKIIKSVLRCPFHGEIDSKTQKVNAVFIVNWEGNGQ